MLRAAAGAPTWDPWKCSFWLCLGSSSDHTCIRGQRKICTFYDTCYSWEQLSTKSTVIHGNGLYKKASVVQDLGILVDSHLKFGAHVHKIVNGSLRLLGVMSHIPRLFSVICVYFIFFARWFHQDWNFIQLYRIIQT